MHCFNKSKHFNKAQYTRRCFCPKDFILSISFVLCYHLFRERIEGARVSRVDEPYLCWRYRENIHAAEFQAHRLCHREGALLRGPRIETPGIGTLLDQANQSVDSVFDTGHITVPAYWLPKTTLESTYMSSHPVPWLWEQVKKAVRTMQTDQYRVTSFQGHADHLSASHLRRE